MSIKPKWVEKIANGEKTVEVRKTVPKCGTPFKVYMYCTNDRKETLCMANGQGFGKKGELYLNGNCYYPCTDGTLNGKVVGEFVCDKIYDMFPFGIGSGVEFDGSIIAPDEFCRMTCLTEQEICDYVGIGDGYGLHISDLKIYDKPKALSEFWTIKCHNRKTSCGECNYKPNCIKDIDRPPHSWQYVEEL